jgi:hypothetical protein
MERLISMRRVIGTTAVAGAVAVAIAACGTPQVPPGGAGAAPAGTAAPTSTASSGASSSVVSTPAAATPKQRADADAASILASFTAPPGAVRLSAAPASAGALAHAPFMIATADVVDNATWWRVPGEPQTVLAWEAAHLASRFTASGHTTTGGTSAVSASQFTLPPVSGVLSSRELNVQAVGISGGQTVVRVDAEVTWIPVRPAAEHVPAAAKAVTVSVMPGMVADVRIPGPVTITDPAKVSELISAANALPVWSGQRVMCPADFGQSVRLTFTAKPGGPALAVAVASVGGCGLANFSVGGKPQPPLSDGATLARKALAVSGLSSVSLRTGGPKHGGGVNPGGPMIP